MRYKLEEWEENRTGDVQNETLAPSTPFAQNLGAEKFPSL